MQTVAITKVSINLNAITYRRTVYVCTLNQNERASRMNDDNVIIVNALWQKIRCVAPKEKESNERVRGRNIIQNVYQTTKITTHNFYRKCLRKHSNLENQTDLFQNCLKKCSDLVSDGFFYNIPFDLYARARVFSSRHFYTTASNAERRNKREKWH